MKRFSARIVLSMVALCSILCFSAFLMTNQAILNVQATGKATGNTRARPGVSTGDWPTYQGDARRSGFNSYESIINQHSAASLTMKWSYQAGGGISSQPIVANGKIYWGSWDGYEHATSLAGNEVWRAFLGQAHNTKCPPTDAGVAGTATFATVTINGNAQSVIFVAGGTATFYALDAKTGAILWQQSFGRSPNHMIWGGSVYSNGSVYVGIASYGDCPLVRGKLVKMDAATGAIQSTFTPSPQGCLGDDIWSTPTLEVATNLIYVSTGNGQCSQADPYSSALIALHTSDLSVAASWQVPTSNQVNDSDFGSTPTLFQATINGTSRAMIGLVNKNGYYYALDRANLGAGPLWLTHISQWIDHKHVGQFSISTSSWDGNALYIGGAQTVIKKNNCAGNLRAINPASGAILWAVCLNAPVIGAVTAVTGVVVVDTGNAIILVNAASGQALFTYTDSNLNSLFWGSASIVNGVLYAGNNDGNLYALAPPGNPTPTPTATPSPTGTAN